MDRRSFLSGSAALTGAATFATASVAAALAGPDVTCRLTIREMLDQDVPALLVAAIAWDSGFHGSGLRVGDQIVAIDGTPIVSKPGIRQVLGSLDEAKAWAAAKRGVGARVTLTARRRAVPGTGWKTVSALGSLRPANAARNARNDPILGPGGPPEMFDNDGFSSSWGSWYEQEFAPLIARNLGDPFTALSQTTRSELKQLQQHGPRVDLLTRKYPGAFAHAAREDYDATVAQLQGEKIELNDKALAWRREEEARTQQVRDLARAAWDTAVTKTGETIPPFPAIDPTRQDRKPLIGKRLVLPPMRNSDWISDTGHTWFAAGSPDQGYYFLDAELPEVVAALIALERYRRVVAPNIDESYQFLVEIIDAARLGAVGGGAYFGLQVRLAAALVGEAMFVDVTARKGDVAPFAGEAEMMAPRATHPPDDASPETVMHAFVDSVKEGDLAVWKSLFADWWIDYLPDRRPLLYPHDIRIQEDRFEDARRLMLGRVFEARPVWTGEPRLVIDGRAYPGALRIEEVDVELRHYGQFDGEYRSFSDVTLSAFWKLQRVNGGPWRISGQQVV